MKRALADMLPSDLDESGMSQRDIASDCRDRYQTRGKQLTIDLADDESPDDNIVPIESLTGHRDRFQCLPLDAVLTAGSCVIRQRQAGKFRSFSSKCWNCADGRQVQTHMDALNTEKLLETVTPENTNGIAHCDELGCLNPPGKVRSTTPPDLVRYCVAHRKKKLDAKRWSREARIARKASKGNHSATLNSSPGASPMPPLSLTNPAVLADLYDICLNVGRHDLALSIGGALAEAIHERKKEGSSSP